MDTVSQPAAPAIAEPSAPSSATPAPAAPPSIHVRAAITWLAIFPLVATGMMVAAPLSGGSGEEA